MMGTKRLAEIAYRRTLLVMKSDVQRTDLNTILQAWKQPLALADQGVSIWRMVRAHPLLLAGVGGILAMAWPLNAMKWLQRGWGLWCAYRSVAPEIDVAPQNKQKSTQISHLRSSSQQRLH